MSQAPVMPLFTDALIGDTTRLSTEEFGAYLLILIATWRNNGKPFDDDDHDLAHICRMTELRWRTRIKPRIIAFFDLSGGVWRQKRLETEWNRIIEKIEINRANGNRGGRPNRLKTNDTPKPNGSGSGGGSVTRTVTQTKPIHEPDPEDSDLPNGRSAGDPARTAPPDPVKELWDRGVAALGPSSRGLIGKMRKRYGDPVVAAAIVACEDESPSDAAAFFIRCCEARSGEHENGKRRRSPAENLFLGAMLAADALDRRDAERAARESGAHQPPALSVLDGGRSA